MLTPVDFQDAVVIIRNVKPAVLTGLGKITTDKPELVFSAVRNTATAVQSVTVTNTGTTPLAITAASVAGTDAASFTVTGGPATLPAGGTATYGVRFNPTSASTLGAQSAALRAGLRRRHQAEPEHRALRPGDAR